MGGACECLVYSLSLRTTTVSAVSQCHAEISTAERQRMGSAGTPAVACVRDNVIGGRNVSCRFRSVQLHVRSSVPRGKTPASNVYGQAQIDSTIIIIIIIISIIKKITTLYSNGVQFHVTRPTLHVTIQSGQCIHLPEQRRDTLW